MKKLNRKFTRFFILNFIQSFRISSNRVALRSLNSRVLQIYKYKLFSKKKQLIENEFCPFLTGSYDNLPNKFIQQSFYKNSIDFAIVSYKKN